jgi:mannose-6-phosphate isomerase-like protein (cupin superfamily)
MKSVVLVFAGMCLALPAQAQQQGQPAPAPYVLKEIMPAAPKGDQLEARVRAITFPPGTGSWIVHPTPVVVYVVEGMLVLESKDKGIITQIKTGEAGITPVNTVMRSVNPAQTPTKLVVFQVSPPETPFSQAAPSQ